jgi:hypothetical protein
MLLLGLLLSALVLELIPNLHHCLDVIRPFSDFMGGRFCNRDFAFLD